MVNIVLAVFLVCINFSCAFAYHFEWYSTLNAESYSSEMFMYSDSVLLQDSAGYNLLGTSVDAETGAVIPEWSTMQGTGYDVERSDFIRFEIVSDFGNIVPESVDIRLVIGEGEGPAKYIGGQSTYLEGSAYAGYSLKIADSEYDRMAGYYPYTWHVLQLQTNTTYYIESTLFAGCNVNLLPLPESFASQQELDDWLAINGSWDSAYAEAYEYLDYSMVILDEETYSAIPEPSTMLLFLSGLAGLAAVGRRRE